MKKVYLIILMFLLASISVLSSCLEKPVVDGSYDFVIYESDSDNSDLTDNKIVAKYTISYVGCQTVTDTLIKKDGKYYFSEESNDYLVLADSGYGLTYTQGYFANYSECASGQIDVSWSYTAVNGAASSAGIGETPLDGLNEYGFVINGWK